MNGAQHERVVDYLNGRRDDLVRLLESLTRVETPSSDAASQAPVKQILAKEFESVGYRVRLLSGVKNLNVAVREWNDDVVFLHQIVEGAADKSYGIHVARLAGVPRQVNERAKDILAILEDEHIDPHGRAKVARRNGSGGIQLTLFGPVDHPVVERLRELDINQMAPLEALSLLSQWQQELLAEDGTVSSAPR